MAINLCDPENLAGQVTTTAWDCCLAYGYNEKSELTNAVAAVDSDYRYSYAFDDIGNRETSTERGTNHTYTANSLNQYTLISNLCDSASLRENFTPQFDNDGSQTLVKTSTGIWQVQYNGENRPVLWSRVQSNDSSNTNNQTILSMFYDRMGRRVTKNNQRFVYDGYLQIADNFGNAYIWNPTEKVATRPLAWRRGASVAYYAHDGNKNVSEVVAENGDVAAHYEYAPFGAVIAQSGPSAVANPWRFSSEYAEDDTATVYYNYRHYEPVTGRWMSRDPIAFLKNLYCYCNNFCLIDWLGLFTFDDFNGKPPEDAPHGAYTYWELTRNPGRKETALVGEYTGDDCKEAIQGSGMKKKVCPCLKCYRYKARYPDFSLSVSLNGEKSWVKDIARNDADLLKHEQVHFKIAEKEAEKEANRIKNTWIEGELNCDVKWAEYKAKESLVKALQSLYDGAYDNIMDKQNKYDSETEHGTIPDKQDEWNKKYE